MAERSPQESPKDVIVNALAECHSDALGALEWNPVASTAFAQWKETAAGISVDDADAEALFASEAAFAAAARIVFESRLGHSAGAFTDVFPHLYDSPFFSWYSAPDDVHAALERGLAADHAEGGQLLGWLYQFSIPAELRSKFGHFYTNQAIVNSILDGVGFAGPEILNGRLIDPACGAGAFIVGGTQRVIKTAVDEGLAPAEICAAVQRVIHGLDLNPLGVLLSEAAIALLLAPYLAQLPEDTPLEPLHLYATDSLRQGELSGESHADVAEEIKTRTGDYEGGFDYVVANPPYAKFPTRLMSQEQLARFADTTYGHPNLYGLFLQVGAELLADGGRLGFINPKSFVSGLYFRNLRRYLTAEVDLTRFDSFDKRTGLFDGVLQEVIILFATKTEARSEAIELRSYAGSPDGEPETAMLVPPESVLLGEDFDHAFFIAPDAIAHSLLDKMRTGTKSLGSLGFKAVTGTVVWNRLKDLVRDQSSPTALPLIWGNGIREYRFIGLGNRAGGSTHIEVAPKTQNIISFGEALLVKRMTAKEEKRRIVACRVPADLASSEDGYFAENHVNIIRPTDKAQVDLDVVLGLLNSHLFDVIFRALNGNTQVSATELEMLPIKVGPQLNAIAKQARILTASDGKDLKARAAIDQLVYQLYGLTADEIAQLDGTAAFAAAAS
jgi:adenine-specific DNA-methyltransferase